MFRNFISWFWQADSTTWFTGVLSVIFAIGTLALVYSEYIAGEDGAPVPPVVPTAVAGVIPTFTAVPPTPTPTPPNRQNCAAIRGTDYLSDAEQAWFAANCLGSPTASALLATAVPANTATRVPATPTALPPEPTRVLPDPAVYLGSTSPPSDFCTFAPCIANFATGTGFVIQCVDGLYSKEGGRPSACSGHGGLAR